MYRTGLEFLKKWKDDKNKDPLVIYGARQVGKTWLVDYFGKNFYKNYIYLNFENTPQLSNIFDKDLLISRIIDNLETLYETQIDSDTLIFFDEIQKCNKALTSLKYFSENKIKYDVIAAGSLLGIHTMKGGSFPVGKVKFFDMYPLSFKEFLIAKNKNNLIKHIDNLEKIENILDLFFDLFLEEFNEFLLIGGMPKVINNWLLNNDKSQVESLQLEIFRSYDSDATNYAQDANKIQEIFQAIPNLFQKENKRFTYRTIKSSARGREYEKTLNWLFDADIFYKVCWNSVQGIPKKAYDDRDIFKIFLLDVGLLKKISEMSFDFFKHNDASEITFKGRFYENYIFTSLLCQFGKNNLPSYWSNTRPQYEIDFLIQYNNLLIPIEVKSSTNVKSLSFNYYNKTFNPKLRVRYSLNNLSLDGNILNIPLFLSDWTLKFIDLALKELNIV